MNSVLELHAIFKGRVQGVGFRWAVVDCAEQFHLTGTVKNLADGTVEVYAQGPKLQLEQFLDLLCNENGAAHIESVSKNFKEPQQTYSGFKIIF